MLNGIIIINWISNGLLLVVQVRCSQPPSVATATDNSSINIPLYIEWLEQIIALKCSRYLRADTCNLGSHCFHLAFGFGLEFITQLCSTSSSHLSNFLTMSFCECSFSSTANDLSLAFSLLLWLLCLLSLQTTEKNEYFISGINTISRYFRHTIPKLRAIPLMEQFTKTFNWYNKPAAI